MLVRPVHDAGEQGWIEMRHPLQGGTREVHVAEVRAFLAGSFRRPWAGLVAIEGQRLIGLIEPSVRPSAEGCSTSACLEG